MRKRLAIASVVCFILLSAVIFVLVGKPLVQFVSEPGRFREWVDSKGIWGRLAYMGMVILQVIVALIPGEPFEIAAGYAFGAVEGTIISILAAGIGSMGVFLLVRRFGRRLVTAIFPEEKVNKLNFLHDSPRKKMLFLLIFMIPGTPKDLLSYFAGLLDISPLEWFLICTLGRIPSVITSTIGGDALGTKNYTMAIVVFLITFAISAVGIVIYNHIGSKKSGGK